MRSADAITPLVCHGTKSKSDSYTQLEIEGALCIDRAITVIRDANPSHAAATARAVAPDPMIKTSPETLTPCD